MLEITLICVGKLKERFYVAAAEEYRKRLCAYCNLNVVEVPERLMPDNPSGASIFAGLQKESESIIRARPEKSYTVALCVEGHEMSSIDLSEFLAGCAGRRISKISFAIGGSHGLHESLKNDADYKLSLSKMTFPHNLARVVLLEQLYRAFNIAGGGKYHK